MMKGTCQHHGRYVASDRAGCPGCLPVGLGRARAIDVNLRTFRVWPLPLWLVGVRVGRAPRQWSLVSPWGRLP